MVQHIMYAHDETYHKIVLDYIDKVKDSSHNAPPLYVNILMEMFQFFEVPLKDEEWIELVDSKIKKRKTKVLEI